MTRKLYEFDEKKAMEQFKLKLNVHGFMHHNILRYLGLFPGNNRQITNREDNSDIVLIILKEQSILTNKSEFKEFLGIISHLWEVHQSKKEIKDKIQNLLITLKSEIKNILSEKEIYNDIFLFDKNQLILLFLVEQNILSIETIIQNLDPAKQNDCLNIKFFYPEIRKNNPKYLEHFIVNFHNKYQILEFIEENDKDLELFYEIRKKGKKESKIIELIRDDKFEEFVTFVEKSFINLNKEILKARTILETDTSYLTPIEYSALFGSIAIFKYLYLKNVEITDEEGHINIIEYAIQGRNYEIIHLLEERKEILEELNDQKNQYKYLKISIKMHYNEIFEYFISNYNFQITKEITGLIIKYRDYKLLDQLIERNQLDLEDKGIVNNIFNSFVELGNSEIVGILLDLPYLDYYTKYIIIHNNSFEMIKIRNKAT